MNTPSNFPFSFTLTISKFTLSSQPMAASIDLTAAAIGSSSPSPSPLTARGRSNFTRRTRTRTSSNCAIFVRCSSSSFASAATLTAGSAASTAGDQVERSVVRLGLPSKGRMSEHTLSLLKSCQLTVRKPNPRQYTADIPLLPNLEVWFQRPKDIIRKLLLGDVDLGIVGYDTVSEFGQGNEDLVIVHDALDYGACRLALAIPKEGIFENINSIDELSRMTQWTAERPLRVVTGFTYLGPKFLKEKGLKHVTIATADGALESCPAMGMADAIVDLVSSGTTLRENNLKEIEGGTVLESQAVLVASKRSLRSREGVLEITHEMLERLEAHLRATGEIMVTANMRGHSAEEVAHRVLSQTSLSGLQGPTISPVHCLCDGKVEIDYYAINIVVPQKSLYKSIQQLRSIGGSGVLVSKLTYIFDEETPRWRKLLSQLGI